jgi:hypothetical protein
MNALSCGEFRDLGPDLALGLLTGDERAAALHHVARCDPCRRQLDGLAEVADQLLLLAPSVEPEIGFESRVMARLHADGAFARSGVEEADVARSAFRERSWRRPARSLLLGIAAALIVVGGVTGLTVGLVRGRSAGRTSGLAQQAATANQLAARTVVVRADGGRSTCQLVAFPAQGAEPARLAIALDEAGQGPESYQVAVEPSGGGAPVLVGTITMANGHGTLVASIPAGTGPVDGVRIMDSPGTVKYHATFQAV